MSVFTRSLDKHTAEKVCMYKGGKKGKEETSEGSIVTLLKMQGATSTCKKGVIRDLQHPITMLCVGGRGCMGTGPTRNVTVSRKSHKFKRNTPGPYRYPWGFTALNVPVKYDYFVLMS